MVIQKHQNVRKFGSLCSLKQGDCEALLCFRDFNEITGLHEKQGGRNRSEGQMAEFRGAIDFCQFRDLGFSGPKFTWCNHKEGSANVKERLDRFFATYEWAAIYPKAEVRHCISSYLHHLPVLIDLCGRSCIRSNHPRLF